MSASKWTQGVNEYAEELRGTFKENYPDGDMKPKERHLLNGAQNWSDYSYGGCTLIYDRDIAERLATPSEIKSRTRKDGSLNNMANARETWLDVQARALYQAAQLVTGDDRHGL